MSLAFSNSLAFSAELEVDRVGVGPAVDHRRATGGRGLGVDYVGAVLSVDGDSSC